MNINSLLSTVEFHQPLWFFITLIPFVLLLINQLIVNRQLPESYFEKKMSYWYLNNTQSFKSVKRWSVTINLIFWLSLAIAMAGPEYAEIQNNEVRKEGDIFLIMLDVSASMNARDEQPSRLLRAKSEISLLTNKLKPGDKLGVVLFAGSSHLLFSPTSDTKAMPFFIKQIKPHLLPIAGSNFSEALLFAQKILSSYADRTAKYVLLISDGDINNEKTTLQKISGLGLTLAINTLGIGKNQNAPVPASNKTDQWQRNTDDTVVVSNRNDNVLQQIAQLTNGNYRVISDAEPELDFVDSNERLKNNYTEKKPVNTNWIQLYHPFLFIAIILFFYQRILKDQ